MKRWWILMTALSVSVWGCGTNRVVPGAIGESSSTPEPETNLEGLQIETFLETAELRAGQTAIVTCVVSRDREQVTDVPVVVVVSPTVDGISVADNRATFSPTVAGEYRVWCQSAGGDLRDSAGAALAVTPAEVVALETEVNSPTLVAGEAGLVGCTGFDQYQNRITDVGQLIDGEALTVERPVEVLLFERLGLDFTIRGTVAGDYEVGCRLGDVVDETPESITVIAGAPASSVTSVVPENGGPTEPFSVTCSVFDTYGNLLTGYDTRISVGTLDATAVEESGLLIDDHEFTVAKTGTYLTFCWVPGYSAGDESPAIVEVEGGLPFSWYVDLLDQDCFFQGLELPLTVQVYDRWGNQIENPQTQVTVSSDFGEAITSTSGLIFESEGDFDITVSLTGELDPLAEITDYQANVRVDSTPPDINFLTPERGAMLEQGSEEDEMVTVTGMVMDALSALTSVRVDDRPVPVDSFVLAQPFSTARLSRWGLSVVTASAEDSCGNKATAASSFLRSPSYAEAVTEASSEAAVPSGIYARLNQMFIDDNYRLDLDDMATLVSGVLSSVSLDESIPSVLASSPASASTGILPTSTYSCSGVDVTQKVTGFVVNKSGAFTHDAPEIVHLTAVDGALAFGFQMGNFALPLDIAAALDLECSGSISENISGEVRLGSVAIEGEASIELVDGVPQVSICEGCLTVDFADLTLDFNWGSLGFLDDLLNQLTSNLVVAIEEPVEGVLAAQASALMPDLLGDVLANFVLGTAFELPPPLDVTLNISSGLDALSFAGPGGAGYGELGMYTQVFPSARGVSIPSDARGAIMRSPDLPSFSPTYPFGLGLSDNLVNQVLWAGWYSGALDFPDIVGLFSSANTQGIELSFTAGLPPVVMPGRNGNEIEMGIGDMHITATVDLAAALGQDFSGAGAVQVELYVSAIIGAEFGVLPDQQVIAFEFDEEPAIWVEVASISEVGYESEVSALLESLVRLMLPELLGSFLSTFPIPEFDLGGLAGLETGESWTLQDISVARSGDFVRLMGRLE